MLWAHQRCHQSMVERTQNGLSLWVYIVTFGFSRWVIKNGAIGLNQRISWANILSPNT